MRPPRGLGPSGACLAIIVACGACLHKNIQTGALTTVKNPAVTSSQLQMRVYETGRAVSAMIEAAADSIRSRNSSPTVRQRALLWKLSAIPLVEEASLRNDPGIAAVDLLAFAIQQRNYFQSGDGQHAFGREQWIALEAADSIESRAQAVVARASANPTSPTANANMEIWVAAHPISGPEMHRPSILASDWHALGVNESSLFGTVVRMERSLDAMSSRLGYLNEGWLERITWQAQLAASAVVWTGHADTLFGGVALAARQMGNLAAIAPATVDAERRAVFHGLAEERTRVFESLDAERVAVQDGLTAQRTAIFDEIRVERIATLASLDSITQRSIDHTADASRRLAIDIAGLAALLLILAGAVAALVVREYAMTAEARGLVARSVRR